MSNNQLFSAVVIAVAGSAIATLLLSRFVNAGPEAGRNPSNVRFDGSPTVRYGGLRVDVPTYIAGDAAPVVQTTPTTEAAYNQQPLTYGPAFGPDSNQANLETILPM